jgi:hypothetical protein
MFDALYYSVNYDFANRLAYDGAGFDKQCGSQCYNLGTVIVPGATNTKNMEINEMIQARPQTWTNASWFLTSPYHVNLSWSQGEANMPDHYGAGQAQTSAMKPWNGSANGQGVPGGGRSGYSVKIVSKKYLQGNFSVGGASGGSGKILNAPQ